MATVWISISEFARNEFLVKSYWTEHYKSLGLVFPSEPINGALSEIWSLLFAAAIFIIAKKFTLWQTTFLSWFVGFVLMWVVIGNLGVLPAGLLYIAIPLSLLEASRNINNQKTVLIMLSLTAQKAIEAYGGAMLWQNSKYLEAIVSVKGLAFTLKRRPSSKKHKSKWKSEDHFQH